MENILVFGGGQSVGFAGWHPLALFQLIVCSIVAAIIVAAIIVAAIIVVSIILVIVCCISLGRATSLRH